MKSPPTNDEAIDAAFIAMYNESYEQVRRFVRRRAHPLNVDDVVSDTFIAAWIRRRELPDPPLPWLYGTARNALLNTNRGGNRQRAVAIRLSAEPLLESASDIEDVDWRLDFDVAFRALSERDRELLALDAWENLSAHDASQVLGCTKAAYSMRLTRARRRLSALLRAAEEAGLADDGPAPTSTPLPRTSSPHLLNGTKAHVH